MHGRSPRTNLELEMRIPPQHTTHYRWFNRIKANEKRYCEVGDENERGKYAQVFVKKEECKK